jgi:hypothetical protein
MYVRLHYKTHLRRALRVCVTNLLVGWGPYNTNTRCVWGRASPITKKSETLFILVCHRFNAAVVLIGYTPY